MVHLHSMQMASFSMCWFSHLEVGIIRASVLEVSVGLGRPYAILPPQNQALYVTKVHCHGCQTCRELGDFQGKGRTKSNVFVGSAVS